MAIEYRTQDFTTSKQILAIPDHYVAIAQTIEKGSSLAKDIEGHKIIKAGTIYPSNTGSAIGVIMNDYDVTYGDAVVAVIIHGFIRTDKLPEIPAAAAKTNLKQITFLPLQSITSTLSVTNPVSASAGEANGTMHNIVVSIAGTQFRDAAANKANWTITGETTTKVSVDSIIVDPAGNFVTFTTKNTAAAVAGTVTVVPKAAATTTGDVPANAVTIVTVA